ncbi:hypothetical protein DFJ43DRAFT_1034554 [Lentinula guzmanii]|uniref:Uncharacterized protein n=2 Tax=Lentinula TaxID=5352 RepID=A0AA38MQM0_9AGAR|nr:hypothetical protein DFJ43DRAFT_1034554 [Lentinula guzmanii]
MIILMPIIMDCILAYRLMAVYPRQTTSNLLLAIIFVPIALFKIARITNIIVFLVVFSDTLLKHGQGSSAVPEFQNLWNHAPYPKVEWIFQVIDNFYTSMLFLYQVWKGQSREKISGRVSSVATQDSGITQLRRLFYLALSSFVFPCIFSLIQVSIVFTNPDFFLAAYIFVSNLYIEIICVLFATIWAVKARAELDARFNPGAYPVISTEHNIVFGNVESYSESGTQIPHRVNVTTLGSMELNDLRNK